MTASNGDPLDRTSHGLNEPQGGSDLTHEGVSDQAKAAAEDLKRRARDMADDAKARARSAANQQKDAAAERVQGFASALRTAADDLSGRDQRLTASCVEQAADSIERLSRALQRQDLDEIVGNVEDFARRQPVAFLGGAVLTGLVLARFMKSSAARREPQASGWRAPGGGYASQGTSGAGYASQGTSGAGYAPQGASGAGFAPQGTSGAGYAPQGSGSYPPEGSGGYAAAGERP